MRNHEIIQKMERQLVQRWPRKQLGKLQKLTRLNSGTNGLSWKVNTYYAKYFVKSSAVSAHHLWNLYRLMLQMEDHGGNIKTPLLLDGKPYLPIDKNRYQIFPFVVRANKGSERLWAKKVGEALAHIHVLLNAVRYLPNIRELNLVPESPRGLHLQLDEVMRLVHSRLPLFLEDRQAKKLGDRLRRLISCWHNRFSQFDKVVTPRLYPQLIHGDFQPENVILGREGQCTIIDFEKVAYGPPTYDLAKFIACAYFSENRARFAEFKAREFLHGYEQVRSLSNLERQSISQLVLICQLGGLWALEHYYIRKNSRALDFFASYLSRLEVLEKNINILLHVKGKQSNKCPSRQLTLYL